MTRVVIAATSDVARAALHSLLQGITDIDIVGRAATSDQLADLVQTASPDVVLLDIESRGDDPAAFFSALAEGFHGPALVILTDGQDVLSEAAARRPRVTQARGYALLPRRAAPLEIDAAIRAAAAGLVVTHPDFADREAPASAYTSPSLDHGVLTPREFEVLRMVAAGLPNKSIANRLGVSAHTVKFHVGSIMAKLHASSRTEAVTEAIRRGLIFL